MIDTILAILACVSVSIGALAVLFYIFSAPRPKWTGEPGVYRRILRSQTMPDGRLLATLDCGHQVAVTVIPLKHCKCEICTRKASE